MSNKPKAYQGKAGFHRLKVEHFGLQRKIVANMTTESWETIPHAAVSYEPDVTEFWDAFQDLRKQPEWEGVTINIVLLCAITKGLVACPAMNGHIKYRRKSTNGLLELYSDVNISMPMLEQILPSLVTEAEKLYGLGTGVLKLAYVLEKVYATLPDACRLLFTPDQLGGMVDKALATARELWIRNPALLEK